MDSNIQIIEKPDWISWDDIHKTLWESHVQNRMRGISMRYASLSGEEIRERVEGKGKMFCAIKDGRLVGTAAIVTKKAKLWFNKTPTVYAYLCFACVLPEFSGQGVYKQLFINLEREKIGLQQVMFDTHENNHRMLEINAKNGFKPVDFKFYKDHFNIVMVNWPEGCPYSDKRMRFEFVRRKILVKTKYTLKSFLHTK